MKKFVIGFLVLVLNYSTFDAVSACEIYNSQLTGYTGKFSNSIIFNTQGPIGRTSNGKVFDSSGGYSGYFVWGKVYNTQGTFEGYLDGRKLRSAWNDSEYGRLENCHSEEDAQAAAATAFLLLEL